MKHVRLYLPWNDSSKPSLLRQTPQGLGKWNEVQFHINQNDGPCDFVVVFAGHYSKIEAPVAPANTLFIAGEPPAIKRYTEAYLAQFHSVICSDLSVAHPNKHITQQGHPWFCGLQFQADGTKVPVKSYDDFVKDTHIPKTKLLSVVCSDKQKKEGHKKRYDFVNQLKEAFGDEMDLYGTGQNPIADKSDALRPYQYHIAIENSCAPDYWTEKLSDCYLEGTFPFYSGCPNIEKYFDSGAYKRIDMNDPEAAIHTIRTSIQAQQYQRAIPALSKAKEQVLNQYNFFNVITEHIKQQAPLETPTLQVFSAYPEKWFKKGLWYRLRFLISQKALKNSAANTHT
ncbi:glycosyltransferase family 10 [Coraliomargarita sp. SDUM461004]|uniref:Glycosyltransferase family 10 n=1 Tax=Thalassobacterium sedimentorum TaxID=3041258 RepID=A0ABU1AK40_9BACT|nr:glycosyltransferase family 10 [Coraliomargarita sp. SDUM461004]MDQ8195148.1 glycosyltransferase family 10 [Coraliomargarita sp. SDUM461004]